MSRIPLLTVLLLTACPPPPEVPDVEDQPDLSELCLALFAHHPDQDPGQLIDDMAWLDAWLLDFEAETRAGYQVSALDDSMVDALDDTDRTTEGMFGVVVGSVSTHPLSDAVYAMVAVDQEEIHADNYSGYQVDYLSDLACFLDRSCDRLELTEDYTAHLLLGVEAVNHTQNQYLWLETPAGLAMLHRAWLPTPPEVSMDWLAIQEQFYLDAFLPWDDGHYRVQTTWLVHQQDSVPEDAVMNMVISGMQEHSENLEAWLDGR
jgi:hypothetical protein